VRGGKAGLSALKTERSIAEPRTELAVAGAEGAGEHRSEFNRAADACALPDSLAAAAGLAAAVSGRNGVKTHFVWRYS